MAKRLVDWAYIGAITRCLSARTFIFCNYFAFFTETVFLTFKEPKNRLQGIDSASLCSRTRISKPFKKSRNWFQPWRASTTAIFDVMSRQATEAGGIVSLESIPGILTRLQIRALAVQHDNPIPSQFLAPIDCYKIPALAYRTLFLLSC